jgi:hypothetical protein
MSENETKQTQTFNIFKQCFYGCKLQNNTWKCQKFEDYKEADNYAFKDISKSQATRLIPVNCASTCLPNFIKEMILFNKANFNVKMDD